LHNGSKSWRDNDLQYNCPEPPVKAKININPEKLRTYSDIAHAPTFVAGVRFGLFEEEKIPRSISQTSIL
jgi:hypothetical protein